MPNKILQKVNVKEIKLFQCSDGKTFDDYGKAEAHERELNTIKEHPDLALQRITELESRVLALETKVAVLTASPLQPPYENPWETVVVHSPLPC